MSEDRTTKNSRGRGLLRLIRGKKLNQTQASDDKPRERKGPPKLGHQSPDAGKRNDSPVEEKRERRKLQKRRPEDRKHRNESPQIVHLPPPTVGPRAEAASPARVEESDRHSLSGQSDKSRDSASLGPSPKDTRTINTKNSSSRPPSIRAIETTRTPPRIPGRRPPDIPVRNSSLNFNRNVEPHNSPKLTPHSSARSSKFSPKPPHPSPAASPRSSSVRQGSTTSARRDLDPSLSSHSSKSSSSSSSGHGSPHTTGVTGVTAKRLKTKHWKKKYGEKVTDEYKEYKKKMNRMRHIWKKYGEFIEPIVVEASVLLFRTGRALPHGGSFVSAAAGAIFTVLESFREIKINGHLLDFFLEDCIDEVEICHSVVRSGAGDRKEVYDDLEAYMDRIRDVCKNVHEKLTQYKNKPLLERYLLREKHKIEINELGASISYPISRLKFYGLIRTLGLLHEDRITKAEHHEQVMKRFADIEGKLDVISENMSSVGRKPSYVDASTQITASDKLKLRPTPESGERGSGGDEVDMWIKMIKKYSEVPSEKEAVGEAIELYMRLGEEDREKISKALKEKKEMEELRERTAETPQEMANVKEELVGEIVELIKAYNDTYKQDIHRMLSIKDEERPRFIKELEEAKAQMQAEEKEMRNIRMKSDLPSPEDLLNLRPEAAEYSLKSLELVEVKSISLRFRVMFAEYTLQVLRDIKEKRPARPERPGMEGGRVTSGQDLSNLIKNRRIRFDGNTRGPRGFAQESVDIQATDSTGRQTLSKNDDSPTAPTDRIHRTTKEVTRSPRTEQISAGVQTVAPSEPPKTEEEINAYNFRTNLHHLFDVSLREALWSPGRVELGDVGFISREGSFVRLFNVRKQPKQYLERFPSELGKERQTVDLKSMRKLQSQVRKAMNEQTEGFLNKKVMRTNVLPAVHVRPERERRTHARVERQEGHAFMYPERTIFTQWRNIEKPRKWFEKNAPKIHERYKGYHKELETIENLILVTGTLQAREYAFLVNYDAPAAEIRFYVFADPKKGQPWGAFAMQTDVTHRKTVRVRHTAEPVGTSHYVSPYLGSWRRADTYDTVMLSRVKLNRRRDEDGNRVYKASDE